MPRRLKVFRTQIGFYDTVVAAPSQKAALEAWGLRQNEFHKGFAAPTSDPAAVEAACAQPGMVLKRPLGARAEYKAEPDPLPPPRVSAKRKHAALQKRKREKTARAKATREAAHEHVRRTKEELAALAKEEAQLKSRRRALTRRLRSHTATAS